MKADLKKDFTRAECEAFEDLVSLYGLSGIADLPEHAIRKYRNCGEAWIRKLEQKGIWKSPPRLSSEDKVKRRRNKRIAELELWISRNERKISRWKRELEFLKDEEEVA